jgi:hypothetical protein
VETQYIFEDWTPLFREAVEAPPHLVGVGVEIPADIIRRYEQAKNALIEAAAELELYDPEHKERDERG